MVKLLSHILDHRADKRIAAAMICNPYTNQPFRTLREIEEYGEKFRKAEEAERQTRREKKILESK